MPEQSNELPSFLTPKAVAKILNMTPRAVYHWLENGNGPPIYRFINSRIRIRKDDLMRWIDSKKV